MHEQVLSNISLAANVLISDDLESARLLLEEKTECAARERSNRKKHLSRLQAGAQISFDSSNIHLETLRALKDLNSQIEPPLVCRRLITSSHATISNALNCA